MRQVWKFPLSDRTKTDVTLPIGAEVLRVDAQGKDIFLWAIVEPKNTGQVRTFHVYGTGHDIQEDENMLYINTFFVNGGEFVFHAFEALK